MRTLSLKKDTLTELTTAELDLVVGASALSCLSQWVCQASDFQQCITGLHCVGSNSC